MMCKLSFGFWRKSSNLLDLAEYGVWWAVLLSTPVSTANGNHIFVGRVYRAPGCSVVLQYRFQFIDFAV